MTYRRQVYPQTQGVPYNVMDARKRAVCVDNSAQFFRFRGSAMGESFRGHVGHFQLRDLLWATSAFDVFYPHADGIRRWDPGRGVSEFVVTWDQMPGAFKTTALCADRGVVFAGDWQGRYCVKALGGDVATMAAAEAMDSVNHASPAAERGGPLTVSVSHNNGMVRHVDVARLAVTGMRQFAWAVNCTATTPDGSLHCVAGDSTESLLVDRRTTGVAARLDGHLDYAFACAFSPDGMCVATGSQDMTVRLYDVRWPAEAVSAAGHLGAMRVVKFSSCGRFLMAAEPADYVH
ncbi:hypothetical protein EC988_008374, partial [Linderina pennispora]